MRKVMLLLVMTAIGLSGCSSSKKTGGTAGGTAPGSPYCKLAKTFESQSADVSGVFDPAKTKAQREALYKALLPKYTSQFDQAIAAAPADIKGDLAVLRQGLLDLLAAVQKNGYDLTKLAKDPVFVTSFKDPKFIKAGNKVGAYGARACGIPYTPDPTAS